MIDESPEWAALCTHHATLAGRHLRDLFGEDRERGERLVVHGGDLVLDYSKQRVTGLS